jgi:uncharacterized protein
MSVADELRKLDELREKGTLSEAEFEKAKAALLSGGPAPAGPGPASPVPPSGASLEEQTRLWAMFLHFSQFAGFAVPVGGLVVPIILWQWKKSELPGIDAHGKTVMNWIISALIYGAVCFLLLFLVIGFPMLMVLVVLAIAFPIVGGIKANNGEVWKYPLSIQFFK